MKTLASCLLFLVVLCQVALPSRFSSGQGYINILNLEFPPNLNDLNTLLKSLPDHSKELILQKLDLDYVFLTAWFFLVITLCLWAYQKQSELLKNLEGEQRISRCILWKKYLLIFAFLQFLAIGFDVYENLKIEQWIQHGEVNNNLLLFRIFVFCKFIITGAGLFLGIAGLVLAYWRLIVWHKQSNQNLQQIRT